MVELLITKPQLKPKVDFMKTCFLNWPASKTCFAVVTLATALAFSGCGPSMPEIVPISGTVTVNGKPYENVEIKFLPLQEGLDGNTTATGVTDENGKYTASLPGSDQPGGCACACKVTITEGPVPEAVRNSQDQLAADKYRARLKNRPVPVIYTRMSDTPLEVNITAEQSTYDFDIKF